MLPACPPWRPSGSSVLTWPVPGWYLPCRQLPAFLDPMDGLEKMALDRLSGVALVLLGLFVVGERRVLPLGTHTRPGPGYFPLLLAILLIVLGTVLVSQGRSSPRVRTTSWPEAPRAVAILACSVFATLFLERIDYRIATCLILGFLFGVVERLRPWLALALTLGLSLGTFWLFDTLLRVPLPRGAWGF